MFKILIMANIIFLFVTIVTDNNTMNMILLQFLIM